MSSFEELLGSTLRLTAAAERTAAVGAYLQMLEGKPVHGEIAVALTRIGEAALPGVAALPPEQRRGLAGALVAFFRQAADILEDPGRAPGWTFTDPVILQAQGRGSMTLAPVLAQVARGLGDLDARLNTGGRFCDVGTGVGWLAIACSQAWPNAEIVGIDIHEPALDIARQNLITAGLTDKVAVAHLDVRQLPPDDFDLVWLPGPFLPAEILDETITKTYAALRPGGWVAFGLYGGPEDPDSRALADLRTLRSGGWPGNPDEVTLRLRTAGFADVHEVSRTWQAPMRLVVGAKEGSTRR
jgi:Methyltransferase domain